MVNMGQPDVVNKSNGESNSGVKAAFINGIFVIIGSLITALIGAYAVLAAVDKAPAFPSFGGKTAAIEGTWIGTISASDDSSRTQVTYFIKANCVVGKACGTYETPVYGCKGELIFNSVTGDIYEFTEMKSENSPNFCKTNTIDRFSITAGDELNVSSLYMGEQGTVSSSGTFIRK
jgi:hypothetical protein